MFLRDSEGSKALTSEAPEMVVSRILAPQTGEEMGSVVLKSAGPSAHASGRIAPEKQAVLLSLLLVLVTLALYSRVVRFSFINFDDKLYVTENVHVQSGLDWGTVQWAFTTFRAANWHPLTWLSHALDCQLFGLSPAGPHLINLVLQCLNVVLLFWVLLRATDHLRCSALVAALFALHPMNVQSVAWVAERKNLLSMFFFLLALGAYRWYARQPRLVSYSLVAVFYALGLMAKPQVITLPLVLLLWDYWPLQRTFATEAAASFAMQRKAAFQEKSFSWLLMEKLPLFTVAALSATITIRAQRLSGGMKGYPWSLRLGNALVAYVRYLGKAAWPARLAVMYPYPRSALTLWQVGAASAFLFVTTALVIAHRRRRYLVVGWLWFLGTMLPMIGLIQVGGQAMADRYAYLPFIGLFIMICWGAADWIEQRRMPVAFAAGASLGVLLALFAVAHRQLGYWSDSGTLWTHTLQVTTANYVAEDSLGAAMLERGSLEEAMQHFRTAVQIEPLDLMGNLVLGNYEAMQRNLPQAIEHYRKALLADSDPLLKSEVLSNMGHAYRELGDEVRAQACFRAAEALRQGLPK